jgi:hypothetical protein
MSKYRVPLVLRDLDQNSGIYKDFVKELEQIPKFKEALENGDDIQIGEYFSTSEYQVR